MHLPSGVVATQALPVHAALQVPTPPHELADGDAQAAIDVVLVPVVSGRVSWSVPAGAPDGVQSAETLSRRVLPLETTSISASVRQARPALRPELHVPVSPTFFP